MGTGFLYPGQGSQTQEMLRDIPQVYFERLAQATGYQLKENPAAMAQDTVYIQLALLTKAAYYTDQVKEANVFPDFVAGHSIGAFCAAMACDSLSFENAASLVYHRATLMKQAYPADYAMGVIVGLTRTEAEMAVVSSFDPTYPVYLSNENCPMQHTISGHVKGLAQTLAAAKTYHAQTAKLLAVPVPSHCALMDETVTKFAPFMQTVMIDIPSCLYLKNTDGRSTMDPEEVRKDLLYNIAQPVQWNKMMEVLQELGMDCSFEFPPGNTLTKLIHAKFGENNGIRTINLDQHGIDDALFLYQKWR
ncbi:ACP S-malonyltransferase [Enterococcus sp. RIT-PI-f]|uniref:ACP S-malonyltransferase n=1 Tax=Enterococcus sp. RIT-PI-f TaxID=1690244 RepID=UPI0006B98505|nr:acyltransferase domain-containing protein [Enterococcus sp. RIT-PI-f]KPG71756.1 acyl transferase [Enterococcus sp. RIT-PI-f]